MWRAWHASFIINSLTGSSFARMRFIKIFRVMFFIFVMHSMHAICSKEKRWTKVSIHYPHYTLKFHGILFWHPSKKSGLRKNRNFWCLNIKIQLICKYDAYNSYNTFCIQCIHVVFVFHITFFRSKLQHSPKWRRC